MRHHIKISVAKDEQMPEGDEHQSDSVLVSLKTAKWFVLGFVAVVVLVAGGIYLSLYRVTQFEEKLSLQSAAILEQHVLSAKAARGVVAGRQDPPMPEYQDIQIAEGAPMLGSPDAKVTIVEFADYQCPYCKRLFDETLGKIKTNYIDTGKAKFYYIDYAFLGKESTDAAMASHCANEQGEYWGYHDALYENQKGENIGGFSRKNLVGFARQLKLNTTKFSECLESEKYAEKVRVSLVSGKNYGVRGTPGTFVNGKFLSGAQPYEAFEGIIEAELSK